MPGLPTTHGLRKPALTDSADGPLGLANLADDVEGNLAIVHRADTYANRPAAAAALNGYSYYATDKGMEWTCIAGVWVLTRTDALEVTSLPASPLDQQECIYVADATNGIKWHLKYRQASSSAYKWEAVGGPPMAAAYNGDYYAPSPSNNANYYYTDATSPTVVVPVAGDYTVTASAIAKPGSATAGPGIYISVGGAVPSGSWAQSDSLNSTSAAGGSAYALAVGGKVVTAAAGATIKIMYTNANIAGAVQFFACYLAVHPRRVG